MTDKYILNANGDPERCDNIHIWGLWFETADRSIAEDVLPDETRVSTVFLGIDHSFGGMIPVLWETMIFGGPHDSYEERYESKEEAMEGHKRAVALLATPPARAEGEES